MVVTKALALRILFRQQSRTCNEPVGILGDGHSSCLGDEAIVVVGEVDGVPAIDALRGYPEIIVEAAGDAAGNGPRPRRRNWQRAVVAVGDGFAGRNGCASQIAGRRVVGVVDSFCGRDCGTQACGGVVFEANRLRIRAGDQREVVIFIVGVAGRACAADRRRRVC
jgi:hypothetical protein